MPYFPRDFLPRTGPKLLLSFPHFVRQKGRQREGPQGGAGSSFPFYRQTTRWPAIMVKVYLKARREIPLSSPPSWWKWWKIWSRVVNACMKEWGRRREEKARRLYCFTRWRLLTVPRLKTYTLLLVQISSGSRDGKARLFSSWRFHSLIVVMLLRGCITMFQGVITITYNIKVLNASLLAYFQDLTQLRPWMI